VPIGQIHPSPDQPRLEFSIDDLTKELRRDGLLNELVVRRKGELFELVDGERRYRALRKLGWKKVPVRLVHADDNRARLLVFKLNKIRKNYSVEEEAKFLKRLSDEGMTVLDMGKQLNMDPRWVSAHLNIFRLPKRIRKGVWTKQVGISHIALLKRMIEENLSGAVQMLDHILDRELTVSETRMILRGRGKKLGAKTEHTRTKAVTIPDPLNFQVLETIEKIVGTPNEPNGIRQSDSIEWLLSKVPGSSPDEQLQDTRNLQAKIEALEREKVSLLNKKEFLRKALSFKCPHCNNSCIIYRKDENYWVE